MEKKFNVEGLRNRRTFWLLIVGTVLLGNVNIGQAQKKQPAAKVQTEKGLKDYYQNYFPIGVAVSGRNLTGPDAKLILAQFNSVTPENCMKMEVIHPEENRYNWTEADKIVNFAQAHGLKVRGHNLCWHEQNPKWLFKDSKGNLVTKSVLLNRLKDHIFKVVGQYKGRIYAWDVINEAIDDSAQNFIRKSEWYKICGEEYIAKAFEYAHQADPKALLFYNDYNTERPEKVERIYMLLKRLVDAKVPIYGVGLQGHWSIFEPSEKELRDAIAKYSSLGLTVQFTELDMSIYPWEKLKRERRQGESDVLTPELEQKQIDQYKMIFKVFRDYKDVITGVTFWNVSDKHSWLDEYPVMGRKNYPLLFDQKRKPKKAFWEVVKF
ncbi:MAG: endo-1,4-beta-xylanase [Bacteroidota bacterium]|nr:endo-1,4-beta-xylanase [Bacteroidota bacterium]